MWLKVCEKFHTEGVWTSIMSKNGTFVDRKAMWRVRADTSHRPLVHEKDYN